MPVENIYYRTVSMHMQCKNKNPNSELPPTAHQPTHPPVPPSIPTRHTAQKMKFSSKDFFSK